MGFTGGTFTITNGTHSGSNTFQQDRDAQEPIKADRVDYALTDIAAGLTKCILKDGTQTVTANIPMNDKKFTGLSDGSSRTDSCPIKQVQDCSFNYAGLTTGAAGVFVGTLAPAITAYANGAIYTFRAHQAANGSDTLNLNSVGAKSIVLPNNTALAATDITSGQQVVVVYDSALDKFILVTPGVNNAKLAAIAALAVTDSNIIVGNGSTWVAETGSTARTSLGIVETTFTPTLGTQAGELANAAASARYVRIGKMVMLSAFGTFDLGTATSDYITITNLPATTAAVTQGGAGWAYVGSTTVHCPCSVTVEGGGTELRVRLVGGNSSAPTNYDWPISTSNQFSISAIYLEA